MSRSRKIQKSPPQKAKAHACGVPALASAGAGKLVPPAPLVLSISATLGGEVSGKKPHSLASPVPVSSGQPSTVPCCVTVSDGKAMEPNCEEPPPMAPELPPAM